MKKKNKMPMTLLIVWAVWIILYLWLSGMNIGRSTELTMEQFMESAVLERNGAWTGANIRLLQEIHGTGGMKYRYAVDTDCPRWDFHTRYVTDSPVEWVNETSSAVEVLIQDVTVAYNRQVYAIGTYYTVPVLGGISSEAVSQEEWENGLVRNAYQAYVADSNYGINILGILRICIIMTPILFAVWEIITWVIKRKIQSMG